MMFFCYNLEYKNMMYFAAADENMLSIMDGRLQVNEMTPSSSQIGELKNKSLGTLETI